MSGDRVIFHIDCNAYYASVEEILYPNLKQVPMAVCGNPESRRGIILAKNELAKGFGVKTAETIWQAKQKCPELVLAPARHHLYRQYNERINAVFEQYTDQVERMSIDESYLDVTGSLHLFGGDPPQLAHAIRRRISQEIGLTVSVGVSFNKLYAKIASNMKKPDAVSVISRENYTQVVWAMPVSAMPMVGKATEEILHQMHIHTIGDLACAGEKALVRRLGKVGEQLHLYANGLDASLVRHVDEAPDLQSVGNGMTFKRNLVTRADIQTAVTALADSVAARMRRAGVKCLTVQVTIKDANFKVITRQKPTGPPTWLAADLAGHSLQLIEDSWKIGVPIRMLTITALKLLPAEQAVEQISLFDPPSGIDKEKQERLEKAMDAIRDKFGSRSIAQGSIVKNDLGIQENDPGSST